ncbi:Brefeldin A resistance protein [Leucoagaricus sp. SymC.cos]|nr:Brefeldin A resistance protein [Leucoagaricus sp. SymC.cos]
MADQHDPPPQTTPSDAPNKNSPPLTPPDADLNGSDHRQSRKREREVSLEPANTPKVSDADGTGAYDARDTRTPAKRNKRTLETTTEEAEEMTGKVSSRSRSRSHSVSPPIGVGVSPRQEIRIKVRQISQGVEELNWKTPKAHDKDQDVPEITTQTTLAPPAEVDEKTSEVEDVVITDVKDNDSQQSVRQEAADKDVGVQAEGVDNAPASANVALGAQVHDKGLKRRFEERGTSQGPNEGEGTPKNGPEPLKRPRDDEGEDPNPRETKRPSPPPETKKASPKPSPPSPKVAAPKLTGFMAYASVSPFAQAAKGPNIFSSGKNTPASIFASPTPSTPLSSFTSTPGETSSSPPKNLKRSGFEAFASPSSPFSSVTRPRSPVLGQTSKLVRAKSPPARSNSVNSNPFASYIGNNQGFATAHSSKRFRADSPPESTQSSLERNNSALNVLSPDGSQSSDEEEEEEKATSFGEKLRATGDQDEDSDKSEEDQRVTLTEQEVITGEEDELTIHQVRSKLFSLENNQWRERGTGMMKLNVRQSDRTGARLVMRKEAVYTLLLNVTLFHGMSCTLAPQDPRYLRFSAIENGSTTHYNLRLASAKAAQDLLTKILRNIPPA